MSASICGKRVVLGQNSDLVQLPRTSLVRWVTNPCVFDIVLGTSPLLFMLLYFKPPRVICAIFRCFSMSSDGSDDNDEDKSNGTGSDVSDINSINSATYLAS